MKQRDEVEMAHGGATRAERLGWLMGQALGVGVFSALSVALFGGGGAVYGAWQAQDVTLIKMMSGALCMQLIVASVMWAMATQLWRRARAQRAVRLVKSRRGTVVTETLIVLVPFMLLTSGLTQFSVNNMAGMLTDLAAYQAGRTMWVYDTASDSNKASWKARLAAAASVAPVAPGSNRIITTSNPTGLHELRAGMYVSFLPILGAGGLAMMAGGSAAKPVAQGMALSIDNHDTFDRALDSSSFSTRAARKLTFAYECVSVDRVTDGGEIGARVRYRHYQALPWFGWIFGQKASLFGSPPGGRDGYYLTITRTYTLPTQAR